MMDGARHSENMIARLIHRTDITDSVFDYIYVLFWNSLWTVLPVIGIGLFDRFLGALDYWVP